MITRIRNLATINCEFHSPTPKAHMYCKWNGKYCSILIIYLLQCFTKEFLPCFSGKIGICLWTMFKLTSEFTWKWLRQIHENTCVLPLTDTYRPIFGNILTRIIWIKNILWALQTYKKLDTYLSNCIDRT